MQLKLLDASIMVISESPFWKQGDVFVTMGGFESKLTVIKVGNYDFS